jgi:hypothetical protein
MRSLESAIARGNRAETGPEGPECLCVRTLTTAATVVLHTYCSEHSLCCWTGHSEQDAQRILCRVHAVGL